MAVNEDDGIDTTDVGNSLIIGEVRWFAFGYADIYWVPCDGRLLSVRDYTLLYSVIGFRYGGDGTSNFAVPDLRGYAAVGFSPGSATMGRLGGISGAPTATLDATHPPSHTHQMIRPGGTKNFNQKSSAPSALSVPGSIAFSNNDVLPAFSHDGTPDISLHPSAVSVAGGAANGGVLPHDNIQPYQILNACICHKGVWYGRE
ncbi:microcystin dependent MdpB family protein [Azorhizobium oxalatiphilum]|uniref:Microcystin dependent MdpB family protein n=1 Tax=Azorhizobium oxalatiphilum TaxID=980631 RepID=A0A917C3F0_9HYPH|nr:tail fiber protein [Azorhizobium oxalatiphilum]GGF66181.1 microcystin dependent MdpB family protein [Azorhizobium oxalatiphilum]